jgi:hypothetical protein
MKLLLNQIQTVSKFKLQRSLRMNVDLVKTNMLMCELLKIKYTIQIYS